MIDQYSIACELDDDQLKQLTMKCEDVEIESHILTPSFFISKKFREFLGSLMYRLLIVLFSDEISGAYVVNLDDDRNFYEVYFHSCFHKVVYCLSRQMVICQIMEIS